MRVVDFTSELSIPKLNYYVLNPCLIKHSHKPDIFFATFRVIYYNLPVEVKPWGKWWSGEKLFLKYHKNFGRDHDKVFTNIKPRPSLGSGITVTLLDDVTSSIPDDTIDYDSTGFAVLQLQDDKTFKVLKHTDCLFPGEMNQDCRIYSNTDNTFTLLYNGFICGYVCMLQRTMTIDKKTWTVRLSNEMYCDEPNSTSFEKNWSLFNNMQPNRYIYSISDGAVVQNGAKINTPNLVLENIIQHHGGKDNAFFSLGSPLVKFYHNDTHFWLSVGHLKMNHKDRLKGTNFDAFCEKHISPSINLHGKFIYFTFIVLLDDALTVKYLSNAFITACAKTHLPYLLNFAMGVTTWTCDSQKMFGISYGEGDVRTKLLILTSDELHGMIVPTDRITPQNYEFHLLTESFKERILVLGYYNAKNSGDDAFEVVFKELSKNSEYKTKYITANPSQISCIPNYVSQIICGGGDILNPYFIDRIKQLLATLNGKIRVRALGVGLPFPSYIKETNLDMFDQIILRNRRDLQLFKNYKNVYGCTDLAMLLPMLGYPRHTDHTLQYTDSINIGVFLSRTMWRQGYEAEYNQIVQKFTRVFVKLLENYNVRLIFIPMGVHPLKPSENDILLHNDFKKAFAEDCATSVGDHIVFFEDNPVFKKEPYVATLAGVFDRSIIKLHMTVCMRYHAHIFSLFNSVPFVSVATTRKCTEFMHEHGMESQKFSLKVSKDYNPIDFDEKEMYEMLAKSFENRRRIKRQNKKKLVEEHTHILKLLQLIYSK